MGTHTARIETTLDDVAKKITATTAGIKSSWADLCDLEIVLGQIEAVRRDMALLAVECREMTARVDEVERVAPGVLHGVLDDVVSRR